ncbi:hypothetical protein EYF80_031125 [Liparis tanakae]|uniref:Uncharacterized protein n=1 Tax=Liparis tanakae TaxID=230148 RepID=A0A4Z2H154_9TELE|nr:hypothetical protein EYF80_031125 [Liparis tanakae]
MVSETGHLDLRDRTPWSQRQDTMVSETGHHGLRDRTPRSQRQDTVVSETGHHGVSAETVHLKTKRAGKRQLQVLQVEIPP